MYCDYSDKLEIKVLMEEMLLHWHERLIWSFAILRLMQIDAME
jgi:hypothetical protein